MGFQIPCFPCAVATLMLVGRDKITFTLSTLTCTFFVDFWGLEIQKTENINVPVADNPPSNNFK